MQRPELIKLDLIKLVSWDIDGTMYSIGRMKRHLLGLFLREVTLGGGLSALRELATLRRYRTQIDAARLAGGALQEVLQQTKSELLTAEERWYGQAIRCAGVRTGLKELLSFFAARSIPQVVFSDYSAAYKIDSLGLDDRFDRIYVGSYLGFVKPNPKVFERIASDFAVPLAQLLHIGDRADRDEAAARAAGCQCLVLGRDFRSFHSLLHRLRSTTKVNF